MNKDFNASVNWWKENISVEEQHRILALLKESKLSTKETDDLLIQCVEEMRREEYKAPKGWSKSKTTYPMPPF